MPERKNPEKHPDQPLTRRERRALERQSHHQERLTQTHRNIFVMNRANAIRVIGLGAIGTVATLAVRPWEYVDNSRLFNPTPYLDRYGIKPAANIDRYSIDKLIEIESKYGRYDLKDRKVREDHLAIFTELFAKYSGEPLSAGDFIKALHWVSTQEYQQLRQVVDKSNGFVNENTKEIFIREESSVYLPPFLESTKIGRIPRTALSSARELYGHEGYHFTGVTHPRPTGTVIRLDQVCGTPCGFDFARGFGIGVSNLKQEGDKRYDISLEESYANAMDSWLQGRLLGVNGVFEVEDMGDEMDRIINLGTNRLDSWYTLKPNWRRIVQQYHVDSRFTELGIHLANQSRVKFTSDQEKLIYGLNFLFSINEENGSFENKYLPALI